MKIEEYPLDKIEPAVWDNLLDRVGNASPFCRYAWLRLIAVAWPGWSVRLVLLESEGRLIGGYPCVDREDYLTRQSHCLPWGTPAGLSLENPSDSRAAESLVEHWAGRLRGTRHPWRLAMTFSEARPAGLAAFEKHGFRPLLQRSLLVPVAGRSLEDWEASLADSVRNQNRQAVRRGAEFSRVGTPESAPEVLRLAALTARRHSRPGPLFDQNFYRILLDPCGPLADSPGLVRVYLVRVEGIAAAFSVCLVWRGRLWLWDYGADPSLFPARPNNHMYHHVIATAFRENLENVELGVVPERAFSLADFKRSFGGVPYERLTLVAASSLFQAGAWLRRLLHRASGDS